MLVDTGNNIQQEAEKTRHQIASLKKENENLKQANANTVVKCFHSGD